MTGQDIIRKVKSLKLPTGSYIVFGSCPMAIAGIRESNDIDMLVSKSLFKELREAGWIEVDKGQDDKPLTHDVFEAHVSWSFSSYKPTLKQLLASATIVDNIPIASLEEVRKWKLASGRPKDITDLKLIDNYLRLTTTQ